MGKRTDDFVERLDHMLNEFSKIGSFEDASQRDEIFRPRGLSDAELEILYDHNAYARRIVDKPAQEATQRGFELNAAEDFDRSAFKQMRRRLAPLEAMREADQWAQLYGGAAIVLVTQDGADNPNDPLDLDSLRDVEALIIKQRPDIAAGPIVTDREEGVIEDPAYYKIQTNQSAQLARHQQRERVFSFATRVHPTRVIPFFGPKRASDDYYWGQSRLQLVWNQLSNLWQTENAIANQIHTFSKNIFKMKGLREMIMEGGEDAIEDVQNTVTAMNLAAAQLGAWLIDADEEEFAKQTTDIGPMTEGYDRLAQSFAAAADMPVVKLFGTPPAGMQRADEEARNTWSNRMSNKQTQVFEPATDRIYRVITSAREGPTGGTTPEGLHSDYRPSDEPSEAEKVETEVKRSKAFANLKDRGVLSSDEIRKVYADPDAQSLITVELDAEEAPPPPTGAGSDRADERRIDPYSGPDDPALIEDFPALEDFSVEEREKWLTIFENVINETESNIGQAAAVAFTAVQKDISAGKALKAAKLFATLEADVLEDLRGDATDFPTEGDDERIGLPNSNFDLAPLSLADTLREHYRDVWDAQGAGGPDADTAWSVLETVRRDRRGWPQTDREKQFVRRRESWAQDRDAERSLNSVIAHLKWHVAHPGGPDLVADVIRDAISTETA